MIDREDLPETPDWEPECRPWDEGACCSSCKDIIESAQQYIYLIGENIVLGAE